MKKYFLLLISALGLSSQAQQFTVTDNLSVGGGLTVPDFSSLAKDYRKFYGSNSYTFDKMSAGARSVYMQGDNFYYGGAQNLPDFKMLSGDIYYPGDNYIDAGYAGLIVVAFTAWINSDAIFDKDYTPKNIDRSLFYPEPE